MTRSGSILLWAAVILVLDQVTKVWLMETIPLNTGSAVTPFLNLVHIRNPGAAFGLLSQSSVRWLMLVVTSLGALVLLVWALKGGPRTAWSRLGLGLALGGALGNLLDRVRYGQVIDFLDFHLAGFHWPSFNLADASLSVGFGLLILGFMRRPG